MIFERRITMFYVLIIQNKNTQAVFRYDSLEDAYAKYHTELAYRAEGRTSTDCAILDETLRVVVKENYTAPVPEPNAEPTEGEQ